MRPVARAAALGCAMALGAVAVAVGASPHESVSVQVDARSGRQADVAALLGRGALRIERRRGTTFQVTLAPQRVAALRRQPGVASVRASAMAFSDDGPVMSQGILRTGAAALQPAADGGAGLTIAILDLGFGTNIAPLQAAGELPPPEALEIQSFDAAFGLAGRNAYGNSTNHGELVAQTVYDYAPKAQYVFVNYRTDQDFLAAVDALIVRRPDIVVHSNSFIEGPFDGTGPAAQAVDRAAAAGILWFNSAGNYQRQVWSGPWNDPDGAGAHTFPVPLGGMFYRMPGAPITFALTWRGPDGVATDLDLELQHRSDDGATWTTVSASGNRQTTPGWHSERIVGYRSSTGGFFRVRISLAGGPVPAGDMTLISREIDMSLFGGSIMSSSPTPGDAAGAVSVGAVDWRGDRLKGYSSLGPTDDGRLKPDLVAPTDTSLASPAGPRLVGGTSNAAPNAAGAAALLMSSLRRAGRPSTAADVRAHLIARALDIGHPGPDIAFGAGRVRVETQAPAVTIRRVPGRPLRGNVTVEVHVTDPSRVARIAVGIDARTLKKAEHRDDLGVVLNTRALRDGRHALWVDAADWPGNTRRTTRNVTIDNTPPRIDVLGLAGPQRTPGAKPAVRPGQALRAVALRVRVRDAAKGRQRVAITVDRRRMRPFAVPSGVVRRVALGRHRAGRLAVTIQAVDRAGNTRTVRRVMVVR